jgi:amino acid adenylation domain-containing protein
VFDRADGPSLRSGVLRQAQSHPDATAVVVRGKTISYGELESAARRIANVLTTRCQRRPERVGLFAYRSEVAYTGTLAAIMAGAAFVPLNPTFPRDRTAAMIRQAGLDAIIVDPTCLPQLCDVVPDPSTTLLLLPGTDTSEFVGPRSSPLVFKQDIAGTPELRHLPPLMPDDVAYLLFTSGSTGTPKGVPVTHGNAVHYMEVMSRRYCIRPEDRLSQTFDQTFDLSVFDLFMAWTNGASFYAMSPVDLLAPTKFINRNALTVWFSVPSVAVQMTRRNTLAASSLPTLRWSLFCGEPLLQSTAEAWQVAAPNSTVENLYGPTELTISCFVYRWNNLTSPPLCRHGVVPIGRPNEGLGAIVVNQQLEPVADGEIGELCVTGPQTTPGYWQAPVITAERFVLLSTSPLEVRRFYRTGDLVSRLPQDEYVFMGRTDQQIKVLGHRVELEEIEAVLRACPGVEQAVAFGWPLSSASADAVVAFVSGTVPDPAIVISGAKSALPAYAVPQEILVIASMPLNANGKVDRRALREQLISHIPPKTIT